MAEQTSNSAAAARPPVSPTPPSQKGLDAQRATEYGNRLRKSLAIISEKSPSSARALLDAYFLFLAPSRRLQQDQMFPRTVRRHPRSDERSTEFGNKYLLLYFHVGNAILAYYDSLNEAGQKDFDAEATILGDRVRLLEEIAREGIDAYALDGDDTKGYALIHKKAKAKDAVPAEFSGQV